MNVSKMAAKSKKRSSENKLLKLDNLQLKDVVCSICQSILIEPVTLPCYHDFCQRCFNGSTENNALCCPLCRLRIGSWLRTATKQKNLVNLELWNFIKSKFSQEIEIKLRGEDIDLPDEKPVPRLSAPGEIRIEYEAELQRLKAERLAIENKQLKETEALIKKLQQEEEDAHQQYLERLKQDEILAQQIQEQHLKTSISTAAPNSIPLKVTKPKLIPTKIDSYLSKIQTPVCKSSPLLTDDNSSEASTPKTVAVKANRPSPEMIPSYGKILKSLIDKKLKFGTSFWNKENGDKKSDSELQSSTSSTCDTESLENSGRKKNGLKSLLVSLPLPPSRVLPHCSLNKNAIPEKLKRTGSVDSMQQELCYFKPIDRTTPMSTSTGKGLPVRVPCVRVDGVTRSPLHMAAPSRDQYLEGLCHLRRTSLVSNLPSAFVIALNILKAQKETSVKNSLNNKFKNKRNTRYMSPGKRKNSVKQIKNDTHVGNVVQVGEGSLRRTRSMGSIKDENETTPKKSKVPHRKVTSDKKPYLRSDSKKLEYEKRLSRSPLFSDNINKHRVNLAVKKLSTSPLQDNDFKKILEDQLRIEKMIEQEKSDLALAQKMEAEWNGRRQSTRVVKRQVSFNYSLRPAKKIKA